MDLAYIPSPSTGVIHLGPIPLRGYAFCIILGVFVAVWLGNKRWVARGGTAGTVADIAVWAVPFGLVGGRLYHVITDYQLYFSEGKNWVDAFKIWEGGLGIWGAIALGAVGAWIGCRRRGIPLPAYADAIAPGIALAQGIGRWGNWFNQELYGKPTDLPWALKISAGPNRDAGLYHPTFLYEFLWDIAVAFFVIWAGRRFKMGHGRTFALYVAAYCAGRTWTEYLRIDEAHHIFGVRLNVWTAIIVGLLAIVYIVISAKVRPGQEEVVEPRKAAEATAAGAAKDDAEGADAEPKDADPKDGKKPTGKPTGEDSADPLSKDAKPEDAKPEDAKPEDTKPEDAKAKDAKAETKAEPKDEVGDKAEDAAKAEDGTEDKAEDEDEVKDGAGKR